MKIRIILHSERSYNQITEYLLSYNSECVSFRVPHVKNENVKLFETEISSAVWGVKFNSLAQSKVPRVRAFGNRVLRRIPLVNIESEYADVCSSEHHTVMLSDDENEEIWRQKIITCYFIPRVNHRSFGHIFRNLLCMVC